jgi:glucosamine--fructose-6-phosphate aminotransferase (isomerizing)
LQQIATVTVPLIAADEQSTVMTRSFTSMLIAQQYIAASLAKDAAFLGSLWTVPAAAERAIADINPRIREFVAARQFNDYAYLGQGPFYGLACESALKVTEMSVSYAQVFHTLEFRHGPKSIVGPETLIGVLLSESNYEVELEVLQEVKSLGGTTIAITNRADDRARAAADLLIEFAFDAPEFACLAPYVFPGQLLGLYTGLKKGFDPDNPRNLSRAVLLDQKPSARQDNAAL